MNQCRLLGMPPLVRPDVVLESLALCRMCLFVSSRVGPYCASGSFFILVSSVYENATHLGTSRHPSIHSSIRPSIFIIIIIINNNKIYNGLLVGVDRMST